MAQEDKRHIIDPNSEKYQNLSNLDPAKKAARFLDKFKEYIEKFRKTPTFTCAVVQQCVLAIVEGKEVKSNEKFLANIAEYILENIWQDSRRQFSPDNLTLVCFRTL